MKSPFSFIVKPVDGARYTNTKKMGDVNFIVNTDDENHSFTNREGIVVSTPANYDGPIKEGDILLVHHNVFRLYNNIRGYQQSGRSYLPDGQFAVDNDQFFAYKQGGRWIPHGEYTFIENKDERYVVGAVVIPSLTSGLREGDVVSFKPGCFSEFVIDGKPMLRIMDKHITVKFNEKNI